MSWVSALPFIGSTLTKLPSRGAGISALLRLPACTSFPCDVSSTGRCLPQNCKKQVFCYSNPKHLSDATCGEHVTNDLPTQDDGSWCCFCTQAGNVWKMLLLTYKAGDTCNMTVSIVTTCSLWSGRLNLYTLLLFFHPIIQSTQAVTTATLLYPSPFPCQQNYGRALCAASRVPERDRAPLEFRQ